MDRNAWSMQCVSYKFHSKASYASKLIKADSERGGSIVYKNM